MTHNPVLADRVRGLLCDVPHVSERKMFGSVCFMVNGRLVLCVGDHDEYQLLVRVESARVDDLLRRKGVAKARMGRRTMKGWIRVSQEGVGDNETLARWIEEAIG